MANPQKQKGDQAEREALSTLCEMAPDLVVPNPSRIYGEGRRGDTGDLHVFDDVAVQVRAYASREIGTALRSSARDSVIQGGRDHKHLGLGMVPIPRSRIGSVRWLAAVVAWPAPLIDPAPVHFASLSPMLAWLRDDAGPHGYFPFDRTERVACLSNSAGTIYVAPIEAWIEAYRFRCDEVREAA